MIKVMQLQDLSTAVIILNEFLTDAFISTDPLYIKSFSLKGKLNKGDYIARWNNQNQVVPKEQLNEFLEKHQND